MIVTRLCNTNNKAHTCASDGAEASQAMRGT
jgi:hypothetical protein